MTRVKRGTIKRKRKNKILKAAKGFHNARSTKYKQAKQALIRAGQHAFNNRRKKKGDYRTDSPVHKKWKPWDCSLAGWPMILTMYYPDL